MRSCVYYAVVFAACLAIVQAAPGLAGVLTALGIVAFAVAFAYVYSLWMARVIEQSLERAALIEQLEATRAELAAAHHQAGVQAERQRLAGEIHDTLAQGFTSIVTLLQAAEASLGTTNPAHRLCYAGSTVRLTVEDDGKGFDPGKPNGGYGLKGMLDRVRQAGGTVVVTSAPGAGTEVRAEVPG